MNKNIKIYDLKSKEALDVKFVFECKVCDLQEKYYEYQDLYNAIERLPLFRGKFCNYEKTIKDKDSTIQALEDKISILQSDVFCDRFYKYEKELTKKQYIINILNNEISRLNLIVNIKEFINNN